jgi:hypothetical protein
MVRKALIALIAVAALGVSSSAMAARGGVHGPGAMGVHSMPAGRGVAPVSSAWGGHRVGTWGGHRVGTWGGHRVGTWGGHRVGTWGGHRVGTWGGRPFARSAFFHHRFHHRFGGAFFGVGFAGPWFDYGYDSCWVWTPWGLRYVCGYPYYGYPYWGY